MLHVSDTFRDLFVVRALSSAVVDRETFYGRFSTSEKSPAVAERESFHGRFSTSKGEEMPRVIGGSRELVVMLVLAFDLVFGLVRPFVVEPMRVPSESMAPTLQPQDRVLVNKLAYDFASPERGDLVVFRSVDSRNSEDIVKRVVGLPGDEISLQNNVLSVNGEALDEPYAATEERSQSYPDRDSFDPATVPRDHVFVMGDNRAHSFDSRFFGPIPQENLLGESSLRFWPPGRLGSP